MIFCAVLQGAILYAIVTAVTDGRIAYGGKLVRFDQGSIYRIRYLDGDVEIAGYSKERGMTII